MRHTLVPPMIVAVLLLNSGCARNEDPAATATADPPVAVVNGTPVTRDVWNLYVKTRHNGRTAAELTPDERNEALEDLIGLYAGAQEAEKQKLAAGEPAARIELMRTGALADLLFKQFIDGKEPTEAELKAVYDERVATMPKSEFHARHILVDDEAQAKALIAQIDQGGSFEKLAAAHSKDGSAKQGGDLGWFLPGQMVKPFSDAVQQLEPGKYTATPVHTEYGWHIIKLEGTRATTPPPYEAVKPQLGPLVNQQKFAAHLKELLKTAKVERSL